MPAFSFEKIPAPARREVPPSPPVKPRSFFNQMLERLTSSRVRRHSDAATGHPSRAPSGRRD